MCVELYVDVKCKSGRRLSGQVVRSAEDKKDDRGLVMVEYIANSGIAMRQEIPASNLHLIEIQMSDFELSEAKGDGNCMFRSLVMLEGQSESYHATLRKALIDFIRAHRVSDCIFLLLFFDRNFACFLFLRTTTFQKAQ